MLVFAQRVFPIGFLWTWSPLLDFFVSPLSGSLVTQPISKELVPRYKTIDRGCDGQRQALTTELRSYASALMMMMMINYLVTFLV